MAPSVIASTPIEPIESYYSKGLRQKYRLGQTKVPLAAQRQSETDIQFHPDLTKFLARRAARLRAGGLETEIPAGWPTVLNDRMAWAGNDFQDESRFVYHLSDMEITEIRKALEYFKDQGLDGDEVTRDNFPLPILGAYLAKACEEVYNGIGFVVLRGLNVDDYSADDLLIIFLGVSSYIAERRGVQDRNGTMLKHLLDNGKVDSEAELPFHTDVTCDIVATLTRKCSTKGGMCTLASSWTVYNELAASRPDLIHVLAKPDWPFDTFGRDPPYYNRALLYYTGGKAIFNFSRRVLTGHPLAARSKGIPHLTEAQAEALDAVHYVAQAHQIKVTMEKGDMRFINNMGVLHGREAFNDNDTNTLSKRHLIRLWLNNEKMVWKLPPALKLAWARVFDDDERLTRWDIEPQRLNGVPMWRNGSPCD